MSTGVVHTVTIPISASPPANQYALRAPTDGIGGAIRIAAAYAVNQATTSGTATYTLALHRWSTSGGTATLAGTIATTLGGTADHWADDVIKTFSLDSTHRVLDAGDVCIVNYAAVAGGAPTAGGAVVIHYEVGV